MNRKKKIAVVIGAFTRRGGAERMAVETCEYFKDQYEFHVICREYENEIDGISIYKVRRINIPRSLKRIIFALQVRSVLKKLDVDLVHTHERIFEADIFSLHGTPPEHWAKEVLGRKRLNLFDLSCAYLDRKLIHSSRCKVLLPVSKLVEDCYRKYYDLTEKSIEIVHPTVSEEFINPPPSLFDWRERLETPKDAKIVLFVGNNYEHKGLDLVMDSMKEVLQQKEVYLWVGGRGNIPKYKTKAENLGIGEYVRFTGMISENLPHLYRSSNIFVLPSKFDTFGIVVTEALASGVPVLVSKTTGACSYFRESNGIIILKELNTECIKENILEIISNPKEIRFNSKDHSINRFYE